METMIKEKAPARPQAFQLVPAIAFVRKVTHDKKTKNQENNKEPP